MGTLNFTVTEYGRGRGAGSSTLSSTEVETSDAFTTSTSAAYVEDGSGDIVLSVGRVFEVFPDEAMWIRFGGDVATVGDGFYLQANVKRQWEVTNPGKVSVIDVA